MQKYIEIGKKIYNMDNPREKRRMIVFVLRSMWHDKDMKEVMAFFAENPVLRQYQEKSLFHLEQITRAFFYNGATFKERKALVCRHYQFLSEKIRAQCFNQICCHDADPRYVIWESKFCEKRIWAELSVFAGQRKEGCLSVIIKYDNADLYQIVFWINKDKQGRDAMFIGAMQGPNREGAKDLVKQLTKWANGYRTKNLVLYMSQAVARTLGIEKIYAVSNYGYYANNHVRIDRKLKTDFGEFWQQAGGRETEDSRFYELPLIEHRKTMEEVPTRKRAVYRRRFAFLDEVDAQIEDAVRKILQQGSGYIGGR